MISHAMRCFLPLPHPVRVSFRKDRERGDHLSRHATSINASYIKPEAEQLLRDSGFDEFSVSCDPMGLQITAVKKNGETSLDQGE